MKSYTSLEQSRKLAEFLPLKSADMGYAGDDEEDIFCGFGDVEQELYTDYGDGCPCWSLVALLSVIPEYIRFDGHTWKFFLNHSGMYYMNADTFDTETFSSNIGILIDDAFEIILKLKEKGFYEKLHKHRAK